MGDRVKRLMHNTDVNPCKPNLLSDTAAIATVIIIIIPSDRARRVIVGSAVLVHMQREQQETL